MWRRLSVVGLENDERTYCLSGVGIGGAHHRGLRDARMAHQCRLHLSGRDPVARHVHHVIDASQHPDLTVAAVTRAIAGEVPALSANRDQ